MKVVLADDHAIVRQGLRSLLESKAKVEVVGEASDGRRAVELAEELSPDVVIMDIAMPGLNGLEAIEQIKERVPGTRVIILSMHSEDIYVFRALRAGAFGYIVKGSAYDELALALDAVKRNEKYLSPAVSQVLINEYLEYRPSSDPLEKFGTLSQREKEILQLLVEGNSRSEIAQTLSISSKTVDRHKENIKEKLDLKKDKDLVDFARSIGLLT